MTIAVSLEQRSAHEDVVRAGPARPLLAGLVAGTAIALLILWTLGGLTESTDPGLPVTPWLTLWGLPVDRLVRDAAASLTLGFALVGGVLAPRPDPRLLRLVSLSAAVWLAAIVAQVVLTVSEVLGRPLADSSDPVVLRALLTQTVLGQSLLAQLVLVGLVTVLGWAVLGRVTAVIVLVLALVAAMLPALSGHAGLHGGHTAATVSLAVHLLAVGLWFGGLVATCAYAARGGDVLVVRRFSAVALGCVIVLAESGLLNASLRVDGPASLVTTPYGTLVLAKATVLLALVIWGWRQRTRVLTGSFDRAGLLRFAAYEITLFGIALGLSVALSRTAPPAGAVAGDALTLGAVAVLALGVPVVLAWAGLRVGRQLRYPEPWAVAVVVCSFLALAIVPAGILGIGLGALLASAVLLVVGTAFASTVLTARAWPSVALAMVGWCALGSWWAWAGPEGWTAAAIATLGGEMVLVVLLALVLREPVAASPDNVLREGVPT